MSSLVRRLGSRGELFLNVRHSDFKAHIDSRLTGSQGISCKKGIVPVLVKILWRNRTYRIGYRER